VTPQEFFDTLLPAAQECQRQYGIPASFTLAQAALESGWGSRAAGNNLFGIKADAAWRGATVDVPTHEVVGGKRIAVTCKFRAYTDWSGSLLDHAAFFKANRRYAACFRQTTGEGWARAVAAANYATDPDYAAKLIATIRARNLARFDQLSAARPTALPTTEGATE
jgi:flagellum-specific peptidoglycan hydrolase FlgJ